MRKTPLSAPGGNYGRKNNYDWNSRDRGYGFNNRSLGYDHQNHKIDDNASLTGQNQPLPQKIHGDDFIPLGYSSPINNRPRYNNSPNNWRGQGNGYRHHRGTPPSPGGNRGFHSPYRQNYYHDTPKSGFNESHTPHRFHQKQHFGPRRPYRKDAHRQIDISMYVNVKSMLEDPWADLMKNLEKRRAENENKNETNDSIAGEISCANIDVAKDDHVESSSSNINSDSPKSQITDNEKLETTPTITPTATETEPTISTVTPTATETETETTTSTIASTATEAETTTLAS